MKSDQDLITDFRNGDRKAFHKLIRRHHVALLNFLTPLSGNQDLAEELTEKTFLRVFGELEQQAESSLRSRMRETDLQPFSTFVMHLYRTGYVCWLEHMRREGLPGALSLPAPITSNVHPQEFENRTPSAADISALPNDLKPIVVLIQINGLSYSDAGAVLNLSTSSVKQRIRHAFTLLRDIQRTRNAVQTPKPALPPGSAAPDAAVK